MKNKITCCIYIVLFIFSISVFSKENEEKDYAFDPVITFNQEGMIKDGGNAYFDNSITSKKIINELGFGWNLGNTFDAWNSSQNQGLDSETCWGNPKTTEEMIDALISKGFKAIRIPVTWHNHLIDEKYTVDPLDEKSKNSS